MREITDIRMQDIQFAVAHLAVVQFAVVHLAVPRADWHVLKIVGYSKLARQAMFATGMLLFLAGIFFLVESLSNSYLLSLIVQTFGLVGGASLIGFSSDLYRGANS